jgi:acyl dehydratase
MPWSNVAMTQIRNKAIKGLKIGDTFSVWRTFSEEDVTGFAEISRDFNPVHFDSRFTDVKNLDGPICHGLLVGSLLTEIGGQIGWFAAGMNFRFMKPVYPGDTVHCNFVVTNIDERGRAKAEATFKNQDNVIVLEALVTGILPGHGEREVMKKMVAEGDPTNGLCRNW